MVRLCQIDQLISQEIHCPNCSEDQERCYLKNITFLIAYECKNHDQYQVYVNYF